MRMFSIRDLLSRISSCSMSSGGTKSASLSSSRLQLGDMADRADGSSADLADALGQLIDGRFDLLRLFIEEQVVAPEMRTADVPMEVLGLHIDRERVGKQSVERRRDAAHGLVGKIGRRVERRGDPVGLEPSHLAGHGAPHGVGKIARGMMGNNARGPRSFPASALRPHTRDSHKEILWNII